MGGGSNADGAACRCAVRAPRFWFCEMVDRGRPVQGQLGGSGGSGGRVGRAKEAKIVAVGRQGGCVEERIRGV